MTGAAPTLVPWEIAITRSWRKLAVTFTAALAVASVYWQITHPGILYDFVFHANVIPDHTVAARRALPPLVAVVMVVAAVFATLVLRQARQGQQEWPLHREILLTSFMAWPLLGVPAVEFEHPLFTGAIIVVISLALARFITKETAGIGALPDLTQRQAHILLGAGFVTFTLVIGFIAYWRYITFHAETCDASWEIGAVSGIFRHGYPTVSVAAWMYDGRALPAPYFNDHVPLVDYLFVPFFALYRHGSTVIWTQAAFMGAGAYGAYLIGRRWLTSQTGGVLFAALYLLNPSVQGFCLHDVHANVLIIPALLLAVGFMEAGRPRTAAGFALLTAICREEAPVYAACIGLYWMLSGEDRRRFRIGLGVLLVSLGLQVFFATFLMPYFGGHPRWDHFDLFFDPQRSPASLVGVLFLNPLGVLFSATAEYKLDYLAISLVPLGCLALWGWRVAWFALPAVLLLGPSGNPGFFGVGINYSAPMVPAALLMGMAGLRRLWSLHGNTDVSRRWGLAGYVLATALFSNYLYGNIASKTIKLEYGQTPFRRDNQRDYKDVVGYVDALPPFGPTERALWEVIDRVPRDAPILTSWAINPQLATWDVALTYGYSGGNPPPEERVRYIVIDKLPPFQMANEHDILRLRRDARWKIFYENRGGIIFERVNGR